MKAYSAPLSEATSWLALGAGAVLLLMGASRRSVFWTCVAISSVELLHREFEAWRETEASGPDRVGYDDRTSRAIAAQNPSGGRSIELAR
jgi:hypothetical protein